MSPVHSDVWTALLRRRPHAVELVLFYLAFVLAAGFGQWLAIIPDISITLWPPNGVFIATLLLARRDSWPWWIATGLIAELTGNALWFGNPVQLAVVYFAVNALESVVAASLLARFFPRPARLETLQQVIAFIVLGVALAPLIGATIGATVDMLTGKHAFVSAWLIWWSGDATGVLIGAPLTLVVVQAGRTPQRYTAAELVEPAALGLALLATCAVALGGYLPFAYIIVPVLLWAAVRFEFNGAVFSIATLALLVAAFTVHGVSPFAGDAPSQQYKYIMMQLFLVVSALTALVVAAVARQHRGALAALRATNDELEQRVLQRTAALADREQRLRLALDSGGMGAWSWRVDVGASEADDNTLALFGLSRQNWNGTSDTLLARIHPEDRPAFDEAVDRAMHQGEPFGAEFRVRLSDGTTRWLAGRGRVDRDEGGKPLLIRGVNYDISSRKQDEERVKLLMSEVNHRAKNMLALVQAVARQTAANSPDDFVQRFGERVQSLAAAQDLLVQHDWRGVPLDGLIRRQLAHFVDLINTRISITGPALTIRAAAAQPIGLAIHELATNAGKYGSLSNADGRVEIEWALSADPDGTNRFAMTWTESGGPAVEPLARRGFGSTVTVTMLRMELRGAVDLDFRPEGLKWRLSCPVAAILDGHIGIDREIRAQQGRAPGLGEQLASEQP